MNSPAPELALEGGRQPRLPHFFRSWWFPPFLIAVISRFWALGIIYFWGPSNHYNLPPLPAGPGTLWDGAWYLSIAQHGYHAAPLASAIANTYHDFAFWPAWPILLSSFIHLVPTGWIDLTAALAASALSVAALVLWARVLEPVFGRRAAWYTISVVAFAPPAFVLSLAYSEPLFLLTIAAFFLASPRSVARPLLAAFAQATRLTGFAAGASAIPALWRARGRNGRAWAILLAPLGVFTAWWLFLAYLTGNPMGFMLGSPSWLPAHGPGGGIASILAAPSLDWSHFTAFIISMTFVAFVAFGIALLFRRGLYEFGWYCLAAVVPSIALAAWGSMPRHTLVAIPALGAVVAIVPPRLRPWLVGACLTGELFVGGLVIKGGYAP